MDGEDQEKDEDRRNGDRMKKGRRKEKDETGVPALRMTV